MLIFCHALNIISCHRLSACLLGPYLKEALKVREEDGSARVGKGPRQEGSERGVQAHDGPHALRGHGQVLGCDGPQTRRCQRASPQHQLAGARVEHLHHILSNWPE